MDTDVDRERAYWDAAASKPLEQLRAEIWNEPHIENAWEARLPECIGEIVGALWPALERGGRVLDLGCGIGRLTFPIARYFRLRIAPYYLVDVVGIDVSPGMIEKALWEMHQRKAFNVEFRVCDGRTLPDLRPLSAAYSMVTFQHIPREATYGYIRQVADLLIRGGSFRFQFVESHADEFLSHGLYGDEVVQTCEESGLAVLDCDRGRLYPNWTWITAEKRDR